jgi:hypothetical protein
VAGSARPLRGSRSSGEHARGLLGAFSQISDPASRVVAVLRLVSPIGA